MENKIAYRKMKEEGLFEDEFTQKALSEIGNPLAHVSELVDFEIFRPTLESALVNADKTTRAGRPQIDVVFMFKVLFLQRYYGLGDKQIEYQIIDRASFRRFLGVRSVDDVPDEKTVWACKDRLVKAGAFNALFEDFRTELASRGLIFNEGKIIDATFIEAPKQRNTREENAKIKKGEGG